MEQIDLRYAELKGKIKDEKLSPDPRNPGKFLKERRENNGIKYLNPENWVFHKDVVEKVLKGKYDEIRPYSAEFVSTLNCSNRCDICAYKCPKMSEFVWLRNNFSDPQVHMQDLGFAKSLLDKLIDGGIKGVIFTGGGEPFLFTKLEELVAHATEKGADSVVYTNGNCVSERRIRRLIEAKPLLVRVSLNCGTKQVYNEFHNPLSTKNSFERTLLTIESLAEGSIKNPRMSVGVGVVITNANQDDLVESAKRIKEIIDRTGGGIEFIAYRPAFEYYDKGQLNPEFLQKTCSTVENEVKLVLQGTGVKVSNITCRYEALMHDTRTYTICRGTGLYAELGPNGNLYFCCDRNLNRRCEIGSLLQDSLIDIHTGKQREEFLAYINKNKCTPCPPACKSHELNKQFQKIEDLRAAGELYKAELWVEELQKQTPPKMVNF